MGLDAVIVAIVDKGADLSNAPCKCWAVESFQPNWGDARRYGAPDGKILVEVQEGWRFYGPGYMRGPWNRIAEAIRFLRGLPGATVYYGGDNFDLLDMWMMTPVPVTTRMELPKR